MKIAVFFCGRISAHPPQVESEARLPRTARPPGPPNSPTVEHTIFRSGPDGSLVIASSCVKCKRVRASGQKSPKGSSLLLSHICMSRNPLLPAWVQTLEIRGLLIGRKLRPRPAPLRGQEQIYQSRSALQRPSRHSSFWTATLVESHILLSMMLLTILAAQFVTLVAAFQTNDNTSTSCRDPPVRKEW